MYMCIESKPPAKNTVLKRTEPVKNELYTYRPCIEWTIYRVHTLHRMNCIHIYRVQTLHRMNWIQSTHPA